MLPDLRTRFRNKNRQQSVCVDLSSVNQASAIVPKPGNTYYRLPCTPTPALIILSFHTIRESSPLAWRVRPPLFGSKLQALRSSTSWPRFLVKFNSLYPIATGGYENLHLHRLSGARGQFIDTTAIKADWKLASASGAVFWVVKAVAVLLPSTRQSEPAIG